MGEVGQALINDDYKPQKDGALVFGCFRQGYYLEIQRHNFENWAQGRNTRNQSILGKLQKIQKGK
jgi:NOL1/NOP2/fmu family ribosome biogenesis protein